MEEVVFIILRSVNSEVYNYYWKYCHDCIRKFHPKIKIYIVDDNSTFIDDDTFNEEKYNIIKSEFKPGRGEALPLYYLFQKKLAKKAIIVHDSFFLNTQIRYENVTTFRLFWNFDSRAKWNIFKPRTIELLRQLKVQHNDLEQFQWHGAFGLMGIFTYDFIATIQNSIDIFKPLIYQAQQKIKIDHMPLRVERMVYERFLGYIFYKFNKNKNCNPYFGNIFKWCMLVTGNKSSKISIQDWEDNKETYMNIFTAIKVFSGR